MRHIYHNNLIDEIYFILWKNFSILGPISLLFFIIIFCIAIIYKIDELIKIKKERKLTYNETSNLIGYIISGIIIIIIAIMLIIMIAYNMKQLL